jgi:hypothetical protein
MNAWETENRARWGAPRQRADFALVLSASRVTPWARRALSGHATATINSSGASGNDGFGPTRLAEPSIASTLGTAATLRSTALARDGGSWEKLTERRGPCRRALVRARLRLPSEYPRGDRSRSQFFVDEGVSNGEIDSERLASSCRGRAHGTLVVPAIAARRTPRLLTSLGNDFPLVDEEGYPYLV